MKRRVNSPPFTPKRRLMEPQVWPWQQQLPLVAFLRVCVLLLRLWAPPSSPALTRLTESPSWSQTSLSTTRPSKAQSRTTTPIIHWERSHLEFRSRPTPGFTWAALATSFKDT